jgi:hypothetical protein
MKSLITSDESSDTKLEKNYEYRKHKSADA